MWVCEMLRGQLIFSFTSRIEIARALCLGALSFPSDSLVLFVLRGPFYELEELIMKIWILILAFVLTSCEKNYTDFVLNVRNSIRNSVGTFHHQAYERLAKFSDTFGPRLWGSEALELAIADLYQQAQ